MKECGECTACCDGWLISNSYGNKFGNGIPCLFLCDKKCSIYNTRPETCSKYQCAWSQGLFPDWMKPTKSNVLISVEFDNNRKQFLKVIKMKTDIEQTIIDFIENWVKENNTYYIIQGDRNEN
jgi:hypothetical protein